MERHRRKSALEEYLDSLDEPPEKKQQRSEFYSHLRQFYRRKWGCPLKLPRVQGVDFDLFKLYDTVLSMGGWQKVSADDRWAQVLAALNIGDDIAIAQHAVKVIYMRYLSKYEQNELVGDVEEHEMEVLSGSRTRGKGYSSLGGSECPVAMSHRPDSDSYYRDGNARRHAEHNPYDRLMKSLLSGLANEIDFAINVLTLLSHPGPRMLKLAQAPQIITLLMAHIAIDNDGPGSLEELRSQSWSHLGDFNAFWQGAGIDDVEVHALLGVCAASTFSPLDTQLFAGLETEYDLAEPVSWRVFQIGSIMRNLSFESANKNSMATSWPLLKFLFVCINCKWITLRNIALDTLSNIASEIDLSDQSDICLHLLMRTVSQCLHSTDKLQLIRGLETLAGLCNVERNESFLCELLLSRPLLARIFSVVAVKDIMMCVYTLECLYQISELGSVACDQLSAHCHGIDELVALATVEAVSFGPSGLIGMKVVEFHGPPQLAPPPPQHLPPSQATTSMLVPPPSAQLLQANRPMPGVFLSPQTPSTPAASTTRPLPKPPTQSLPLPASIPPMENSVENLTRKWLQSNCVREVGACVPRGELYMVYVEDLRTIFHSLSLSTTAFTNMLKSMFPSVNISTCGENSSQVMIEGVRIVRQTSTTTPSSTSVSVATTATISSSPVAAAHPLVQQMLLTNAPTCSRTSPPVPVANANTVQATGNAKSPVACNADMNGNASGSTSPDSAQLDETNTREAVHSPVTRMPQRGATLVLPSGNQVMLEVCEAAIEARDIMPDDGRHEARIVRVENTAAMRVDESDGGMDKKQAETISKPPPRKLNGLVVGDSKQEDCDNGESDVQQNGTLKTTLACNHEEHLSVDVGQCQSSVEKVLTPNIASSSSMQNGNHIAPLINGQVTPIPSTSPCSTSPSARRRLRSSLPHANCLPVCNGPSTSSDEQNPVKRRRLSGNHASARRTRQLSVNTDDSSEPGTSSRPTSHDSSNAGGETTSSRPLSRDSAQTWRTPISSGASHPSGSFLCEWPGCGRWYASSSGMLWHAANEHVDEQTILCKWPRCDATVRAKWSLVTHLQDHHCSEAALRAAAARRLDGSSSVPTAHVPTAIANENRDPPPQHPGYSKHAAIEAIRRHAFNFMTRDITDDNEGPVTKSIRLTSCLILRNLARYSSEGRRLLKRHERHLCWLALSRLESASALAQCLAELSTSPV